MNTKIAGVDKEVRNDQQQISDCISRALPFVEKYLYTKSSNSIYYRTLVNKQKKKIGYDLLKIAGINFIFSIILAIVVYTIFYGMDSDFFGGIAVTIVFIGVAISVAIISDFNVNKLSERAVKRRAKKILQQIDIELDKANPIDQLIEKSIELAISDENRDKIIPVLVNEIAVEIVLTKEDSITKNQIKRLVLMIISCTFILESLNLDVLVKDGKLLTKLLKVLTDISLSLSKLFKKKPESLLTVDTTKIIRSIRDVKGVIETLQKIESNKELAVKIDKISDKIKKQLDTKPIAKSHIKLPRNIPKISKNKLLSVISASDGEVIEIRTRAGTYYTTANAMERNLPNKDKKVELLTDREIEVKIEVLNSTLKLLEEEKKSISKRDFETIKNEYLMQLMGAKQVLTKRRGSFKRITCPNCGTKNSSIKQYCKKCKNQLPYCIICLSSIGVGTEVIICPHCQSFAHVEHFLQWLEKTDICPYCREKISKKLVPDVIEKITKIKKVN